MTSTQVLDLKGNKVRELNLSQEVFSTELNDGVVHAALIRQLANARSGSANTKTRAEVRGGGAKPWRQKGTGRARAGSRRSPLWEGGGIIFGPKPRDYSQSMPRKVRLLALRSVLASKRNNIVVVQDFKELKEAKTKAAVKVLKDLKIEGKRILIVLDYKGEESNRFALAARNIEDVKVVHVNNINVKDLLHCEAVLTSESAVEALTTWLKPAPKVERKPTERKARPAKAEKPKASTTITKPAKPKVKEETAKAKETQAKVAEATEGKAKAPKADEQAVKAKAAESESKKAPKKDQEEDPGQAAAKKKKEVAEKQDEAPSKKEVQAKKETGGAAKLPKGSDETDSKAKKKTQKE